MIIMPKEINVNKADKSKSRRKIKTFPSSPKESIPVTQGAHSAMTL